MGHRFGRSRPFEIHQVEQCPADYLARLNSAITEDCEARGKRPLSDKPVAQEAIETKVSRADPGSGFMIRDNKPQGFFYLDHRTVDGKHAIITDTFVILAMCMTAVRTWLAWIVSALASI